MFLLHRVKGKLWFRPLLYCFISIACALIAEFADETGLGELVPKIKVDSVESLLKTISASMLVISTFAVGSMISAFSVASSTATPRSFKLVVSDDVSKNALSAFIGSFIFSVVAQVALNNGYYGKAGIFTLFAITILIFIVVILTFLRWVDRISRLGRLGHTIEIIEKATLKSIKEIKKSPFYKKSDQTLHYKKIMPIYASSIGYIQTINLKSLQDFAEKHELFITVTCLPGSFVTFNNPIAYLSKDIEGDKINNYFVIGHNRSFQEDPRFGLVALSEIASRALSPAVNDPGTAIGILNTYVRLFDAWSDFGEEVEEKEVYDRLALNQIQLDDLFDDAFRPIARDGASTIEVMIRLQKTLQLIGENASFEMKACVRNHAENALQRAEIKLEYTRDIQLLKNIHSESEFNKI